MAVAVTSPFFLRISKEMFRGACLRFEPIFFPVYKNIPATCSPVGTIRRIDTRNDCYLQRPENRFRNQIAKNHLQSFMLDIYDKYYRYFDKHEIEGGSRQDEIFKNFVRISARKLYFRNGKLRSYANKLCISTRGNDGDSAKKIIDDFAILEIKVLRQPI